MYLWVRQPPSPVFWTGTAEESWTVQGVNTTPIADRTDLASKRNLPARGILKIPSKPPVKENLLAYEIRAARIFVKIILLGKYLVLPFSKHRVRHNEPALSIVNHPVPTNGGREERRSGPEEDQRTTNATAINSNIHYIGLMIHPTIGKFLLQLYSIPVRGSRALWIQLDDPMPRRADDSHYGADCVRSGHFSTCYGARCAPGGLRSSLAYFAADARLLAANPPSVISATDANGSVDQNADISFCLWLFRAIIVIVALCLDRTTFEGPSREGAHARKTDSALGYRRDNGFLRHSTTNLH
ncbi:hypothetical protein K438DRAFT_1771018 [Mycena galopus ATCC 62051]|nr:hypothetical protein K438DRAFT_1771018 [Mycena galopus ATCC 62051]